MRSTRVELPGEYSTGRALRHVLSCVQRRHRATPDVLGHSRRRGVMLKREKAGDNQPECGNGVQWRRKIVLQPCLDGSDHGQRPPV